MDSVKCWKCNAELGPVSRRRAFISVFVQGDEETRSWYFCDACRIWMVEFCYDHFMGDCDVKVTGPYPEEAWAAEVALAQTCPAPGDKWCRCPAHQRLSPG